MSVLIHPNIPDQIKLGLHAASLLIRRASGEVLWVKRGDHAPFLAGYWAFPGGMVNADDVEAVDHHALRALQIAAIREAREEIGVSLPLDERIWDLIHYVGSWRTHDYLPRVIEGYFFELELTSEMLNDVLCSVSQSERDLLWNGPSHQPLPLPQQGIGAGELSEACWLNPGEMYQKWCLGEVTFAPPTLALCRAWIAQIPLKEASTHSPEFAQINQVTPTVQLLPVRTPTLPPATHTNCYLIGEQSFVVVDPGSPYPEEQAKLNTHIDQRIARGDCFAAVVLTHHHADHMGGARALIDHYQVPLAAHAANVNLLPFKIDILLTEGDLIHLGDDFVVESGSAARSTHQPISGLKADRPIDSWEVWYTPGHASGHLCLIHQPTMTSIVGDMVAGVGTIVVDPDDGEVASYLKSLERLRSAELNKLLPSHGPPLAAPHALLTHYLQHRRAREEKVWAALPLAQTFNSGGGDVRWRGLADIVKVAYQDAPPVVKIGKYGGLAGRSALAHLIHLQTQGRALCCEPTPRPESTWLGLDTEEQTDSIGLAAHRLDMMMSTLRVQCSWDRKQTLNSLKRYLIEESYEVLEVLNQEGSPREHCDELGDLLFQVIFQSKIREEEGEFDLLQVMNGLAAKLSRRHPHVFGDAVDLTADEVREVWQQIKAQERAQKQTLSTQPVFESILDGIPGAAPALLRAQMIGEKAASIGFDWPSVEGALAKVDEERQEVGEALERGDHQELISELGDLFFAIVNVCRHLKVSPEVALERTNLTFSERFRAVERLAETRGLKLNTLGIDELEALWGEVKTQLRSLN